MTRRRSTVWCSIAVALVATTTGCDRDGKPPTAPTPSTLSGAWTGTIQDPQAGTGRLGLTLDERPTTTTQSLIGGAWNVTFPGPGRNSSGTVSGVVAGTMVFLTLNPASPPACPGGSFPFTTLAGSYGLEAPFNPTRLTGPSRFYTCSETVAGTVDLGR